jgi:hypothetical protein
MSETTSAFGAPPPVPGHRLDQPKPTRQTQEAEQAESSPSKRAPSKSECLEELEQIRTDAAKDPEEVEKYKDVIKDKAFSMHLFGISMGTPLAAVPIESMQQYLEDFIDELVGEKANLGPLDRLMVEQILLAHHLTGRLQCEALEGDLETRRTNIQLAITLMGEMRRHVKDIKESVGSSHSNRVSRTSEKKGGPQSEVGSKNKRKVA